ncbi:MAG TPA: peptidoglycan editing factor PgeF [Woeseiaceae bacterium]|nr:peptidoglycan editing factor PgeF [Woeseiaceae bacterium]
MSSLQWIKADWPAPPGIVAGTTCRQGGVSEGSYASLNLAAHVGDDEASVSANRRRFVSWCELPEEPKWLAQVHGTTVVRAEDAREGVEADAVVTAAEDRVCAVLTADCLPVLFTSLDGDEVAAAHAGWRGLCDGVLEATIAMMSTPPSRLMAWMGPAISPAAFEVGDEVRECFLEKDKAAAGFFESNRRGRWQGDIYGLATLRLRNAGIHKIYGGGRCTFSESDAFFSYRRDAQCGRMATFIFRMAQVRE